jgi:hypothetical protein
MRWDAPCKCLLLAMVLVCVPAFAYAQNPPPAPPNPAPPPQSPQPNPNSPKPQPLPPPSSGPRQQPTPPASTPTPPTNPTLPTIQPPGERPSNPDLPIELGDQPPLPPYEPESERNNAPKNPPNTLPAHTDKHPVSPPPSADEPTIQSLPTGESPSSQLPTGQISTSVSPQNNPTPHAPPLTARLSRFAPAHPPLVNDLARNNYAQLFRKSAASPRSADWLIANPVRTSETKRTPSRIYELRCTIPTATSIPEIPFRYSADSEGLILLDEDKSKAFEIATELFEERLDYADDVLEKNVKNASQTLSAKDFKRYKEDVRDAKSFLDGMRKALTTIRYEEDVNAVLEANDGKEKNKAWGELISDAAKDGFEYVLRRLSPTMYEIYEGPAGWIASITLDSTQTQTPEQDIDPMTALNAPAKHSFQQREAALVALYRSAQEHPEVWNESKLRWLFREAGELYNSPDNPNIHLIPRSQPNNSGIQVNPPH